MSESLDISVVRGPDLAPFIDELARLRIAVFRAFPYLYEGSHAYEADYLATYTKAPHSVAVLAWAGEAIVGAATALPLRDETAEVIAPFETADWPVDPVFYLAESVLLPAYRGQGLGVRFFAERETAARAWGASHAVFCAVERPGDHPQRPHDYVALDAFWRKRGYAPLEGLRTQFSWPDLGAGESTPKTMQFWGKRLT